MNFELYDYSLLQLGDDRLVSGGGLIHTAADFGADGQYDVDTGTELDETHVLIDIAFFTLLGVGDDASGYRISSPSGVVIITSACSFSSLAFGNQALW